MKIGRELIVDTRRGEKTCTNKGVDWLTSFEHTSPSKSKLYGWYVNRRNKQVQNILKTCSNFTQSPTVCSIFHIKMGFIYKKKNTR